MNNEGKIMREREKRILAICELAVRTRLADNCDEFRDTLEKHWGHLGEFRPSEIAAIISKLMTIESVECLNRISIGEWLKYRNCGKRFIEKLKTKGWVDSESGLSARAINTLNEVSIPINRTAAKEAIRNGLLRHANASKGNCTEMVLLEIAEWCKLGRSVKMRVARVGLARLRARERYYVKRLERVRIAMQSAESELARVF